MSLKIVLNEYRLDRLSICLSFWVIGIIIAFCIINETTINLSNSTVNSQTLIWQKHTNNHLINIVLNNFLLGFSILLIGYLTLGIYTFISFIFNGLILGLYIEKALVLNISNIDIFYSLGFHAPLEITSFILLGCISLKSWNHIKNWQIPKVSRISFISILIPFALLLLAAFVEYSVIHFRYGIN